MKRFRWLGLIVGVALFAWVLKTQDLREVWEQVAVMRWGFLLVLAYYAGIFGLDTLGWGYTLKEKDQKRIGWFRLFRARLAGEAINYVTPTAWVGGEPVKALLLSRRHGILMADGMASVVIAKTTFSISMFLFILTGVLLTLTQEMSPTLSKMVWIMLPVLGTGLSLFLLVQFLRPFQKSNSALARLVPRWFGRFEAKMKEWDETIVSVYRKSPKRVLLSLWFNFLGWVAGVFEIFLILRLLGVPVSFTTAWSIECLWVLLKSGAFLIPASLGASEGLAVLVCTGFGLTGVAGLALALIRRAREIFWTSLGLAEFSRR